MKRYITAPADLLLGMLRDARIASIWSALGLEELQMVIRP